MDEIKAGYLYHIKAWNTDYSKIQYHKIIKVINIENDKMHFKLLDTVLQHAGSETGTEYKGYYNIDSLNFPNNRDIKFTKWRHYEIEEIGNKETHPEYYL